MRSWLFVPGNRPDMMAKAVRVGADAIILDLEDSVAPQKKEEAREAVANALSTLDRSAQLWVRVNPISSAYCTQDVATAINGRADGLVLPKSENGGTVRDLIGMAGNACPPILAIATETAGSLFGLGQYAGLETHLFGLAWGAEDLSADLGSTASRDDTGALTGPFAVARNLMLAGARQAKCQPIDTVWTDIRDLAGLEKECNAARRDGFTGKMAIHPAQVPIINQAFRPTASEIALAQRITKALASNPNVGAVSIDGQMIDMPHLKRAKRVLDLVAKYGEDQ
ncbi:Citrate lyase subunit beta [Sulfitobacter sp. DSM 110093]|uniref:HpcH/HpaI aldolase/citrate lyase family protein n=1 Tax=Sulfitobacter sp. DSM 110093 TaxID=2883127 RepID=UPI001FAD3DDD|nr:CoA ester lyase [Sulfitobacter sp. DSM 110093]UOA32854.1 Citrate lyase subunit beta [Sulfitobacter sp. DSM 110093]